MTRKLAWGCSCFLLGAFIVGVNGQTRPAMPPASYYSPPAQSGSAAQNGGTQPIRRVSGDAPVNNAGGGNGAPAAPAGNVIKQPPGAIVHPSQALPRQNPQTAPNSGPPQQPRPVVGPIQGPQASGPFAPRLPPGFPLTPEQAAAIDQILQSWEKSSGEIQRFQCNFQCWEYDPVFGPKDKAKVFSKGQIKYMTPDKGLFKETESRIFTPSKDAGKPDDYVAQPTESLKHWVCDGKVVFEFDARKRQVIKRTLPPEMQGKAIADGPLPFLFGMKAAVMKDRYWIRPIELTGDAAQNAHCLEAIPKRQSDAANFKMVQIALDKTSFMPNSLALFPPNYDPKQNPAKATYAFEKLESNWSVALERFNLFHKEFFEPATPFGWKKVEENFDAAQPEAQAAAPRPAAK